MQFIQPEPHSDPLDLFHTWFAAATAAGVRQPEATALATASADGRPSVRMVLLKGFNAAGHPRFFTNYDSRKAQELAANPRAALLLWWNELDRQVRIEGRVYRTSSEESDAYFTSRPRRSQLGAAVSPQSRPIPDLQSFHGQLAELERSLGDAPVPRPAHWGGYAVEPEKWEFWVGQVNRLHERYVYTARPEGGYSLQLLGP